MLLVARYGQDCLSQRLGRRLGNILRKNHELVTAQADHQMPVIAKRGQPPGRFMQKIVAGKMAERIIDRFEAIEVEE